MAYKNIHENFWRDREIKKLTSEEKLFLIYTITGPHSHFSGIYFLPKPYIVNDLGFSDRQIDRCLNTLGRGIDTLSDGKFFMKYDVDKEIIWIRNMLRYQVFLKKVSPKIVQGIKNQLISLPLSPLLHEFSQYYAEMKLPFFAPDSIPYPMQSFLSVTESVTVSVSEEETVSNITATNKQRHLDYVLISEDELKQLKDRLNGKTEEYIERLNNYIGQIGVKAAAKKYRSHYHTILNWHAKDKETPHSSGKGHIYLSREQEASHFTSKEKIKDIYKTLRRKQSLLDSCPPDHEEFDRLTADVLRLKNQIESLEVMVNA